MPEYFNYMVAVSPDSTAYIIIQATDYEEAEKLATAMGLHWVELVV